MHENKDKRESTYALTTRAGNQFARKCDMCCMCYIYTESNWHGSFFSYYNYNKVSLLQLKYLNSTNSFEPGILTAADQAAVKTGYKMVSRGEFLMIPVHHKVRYVKTDNQFTLNHM